MKISILVFNTCYSTNAKSLTGFLKTHIDHYLNRHDKIERYADVERTMKIVKKKDPQILLLMEVLEGKQSDYFVKQLRENGYKSIHVANGHGIGKEGKHVQMILATKQESDAQDNIEFVLPKRPGNGGGMVVAVIKSLDCLIVGVHCPIKNLVFARQKYFEKLNKILQANSCKKVILMGDFNMIPEELAEACPKVISGFNLLSSNVSTCSTTSLIRNFYSKCLDLIFGKGFKIGKNETIDAPSDHRAVYVEIV